MITEANLLNIKNYVCTNKDEAAKAHHHIKQLQIKLLAEHDRMSWKDIKNLHDEVNMWRQEMGKHYKKI